MSKLSWWFREASDALAPGSADRRLHPLASLLGVGVFSTMFLFLQPCLTALLLLVFSVLLLIVRGARVLVSVVVLVLPFLALYVISSATLQFLMGVASPITILVNTGRMLGITFSAVLFLSLTRISDIVLALARLSPSTAMALATALKSFYTSTETVWRIIEVHSTWARGRKLGFKTRLEITKMTAKTLAYTIILKALETSECMHTRYKSIIRRLQST